MANDSGIGTYIRNTVPRVAALEPSWQFTVIGRSGQERLWQGMESANFVACDARIYSLREQLELPRFIPKGSSVFWSPHFNIPSATRLPLVVTIHDTAHLRMEEHRTLLRQAYARTMFELVRRRASAIMFDSDFTRREFVELVGEPASNSSVVHLGIDRSWQAASAPSPLPSPYFVFVGNLKPHKNLRVLAQAMLRPEVPENMKLVVVGRTQGMRTSDQEVGGFLAKLGNRVVMLGEVSDPQLRAYVRNAIALVLPSRYEGFGLPPLEAMAAGTPAIVSRAGSLPEICGDAALYFDSEDATELARLLAQICANAELRETMRIKGRANVGRFDWTNTAESVRDVLARAA
jgi:glycosyltransferase involved in cell wall biosynthesis